MNGARVWAAEEHPKNTPKSDQSYPTAIRDRTPARTTCLGIISMVGVMTVIIATSILLMDDVRHTDGHGGRYDQQYFKLWLSHCCMSFCLLPGAQGSFGTWSWNGQRVEERLKYSGFTRTAFIFIAVSCSAFYLGIHYFWALALPDVGPDCFICLSQLVFVAVFVISFFIGERQSALRMAGVGLSLIGVLLSAWEADQRTQMRNKFDRQKDLAFVSTYAISMAVFQVLVKRNLGTKGLDHGAQASISLLFVGTMGASTVVGLWPGLLLVHAAGLEEMKAPPATDWPAILTIGVLSLAHNVCIILGIVTTSPLIVGVVKALTIPVAFLRDCLSGQRLKPTVSEILGALMILAGFVITLMSRDIIDSVDFEVDHNSDVGDERRGLLSEDDQINAEDEFDDDLSPVPPSLGGAKAPGHAKR